MTCLADLPRHTPIPSPSGTKPQDFVDDGNDTVVFLHGFLGFCGGLRRRCSGCPKIRRFLFHIRWKQSQLPQEAELWSRYTRRKILFFIMR